MQQPSSGYAHWMLEEIYEQPATLLATLARYVQNNAFVEGTVSPIREWLRAETAVTFAASGSSRHASMVAAIAMEEVTSLPIQVAYASEVLYRTTLTRPAAGMIVVSQSGETVDTLAAMRLAAGRGQRTLAITNVETSAMAREATVSMPVLAGTERAVPATKSFTAQLLALEILTCLSGGMSGILTAAQVTFRLQTLSALPAIIQGQLRAWEQVSSEVATRFYTAGSLFLLGRNRLYPVACEGALKLKESAYLHAEAYPAGEWKHGPNAISTASTPLLMLSAYDSNNTDATERYTRMVQLMQDMRAQGTPLIAFGNAGDRTVCDLADMFLPLPPLTEELLPIATVIPLQMLSYFLAVKRGIDPDHPRNLVKAVRSE